MVLVLYFPYLVVSSSSYVLLDVGRLKVIL